MLKFACAAMCTAEEVFDSTCDCTIDETDAADVLLVEAMCDQAADILSLLSGTKITGVCEVTVRPISLCRGPSYLSAYNTPNWSDRFGGVDTIPLRGPGTAIIEILIDGTVIPPANYGLMDGRFLYRKVGGSWPSNDNLLLDETAVGTFQITYRFGSDADKLTNMAAIELACELVKDALPGQTSAFQRGITAANVQGAQVTVRDRAQALREGNELLPIVSRWMSIYAHDGPLIESGVWSPELEQSWSLVEVLGPSGS